jgi:tetratricopeptide (TPR) repeat protein
MSELHRALIADPSNSTAHAWYGIALALSGRAEEAVREITAAQRLDPLSIVASAWLSSATFQEGRTGEAMQYARQTLELSPHRSDALRVLAQAYEAQGDYKSAITTFKELTAIDPYHRAETAPLFARAYELDGQAAAARQQLAYARRSSPHRDALESANRLLFRRTLGALTFFGPYPNRLNIDELVNSKG